MSLKKSRKLEIEQVVEEEDFSFDADPQDMNEPDYVKNMRRVINVPITKEELSKHVGTSDEL